ncbi:serine/threonine-protein kinase ULK4-like, partial [Oncorhynchus masou masou]|uniref:serine/threonine-protein kinase ULK4-like n=1 Tax=Oncorhynchus masou masou TaxID=90313 RepID=UPI0031838CC0
MMTVVLHLLTSQIFRPQVVTEEFLFKFGALLSHITSIDASETSLGSAIGQAGSEELIRNTLSAVEAITQHPALLTPHHCPVVDCILPPLTSLAFSKNVEWRIVSLRVLSEITLLLLSQEAMEEGERRERECNSSTGRLLTLITEALLPQYESLLLEPDPIPVYALKLLVALTEHSSPVNSLVRDSRILPVVFQVMAEHQDNILGGTMQKAMALLSNLTGQKDVDLQPFYQQGLVEVVCSVFSEAAVLYVEREERPGRKSSPDLLLSLLDTLHNVLTSTSRVVRIALQGAESQGETQAAEDLLLINKPLTQLTSLLIQMLPCEDVEVYEETSQCLSLLMQLYGGDSPDSLSPLNLQSLSHALQLQTQPKQHRLLLRIVKRLPVAFHSRNPSGYDMLSALGSIVGRKHPSTVQAKQLKQSVPMMTVVLHLLTSQIFRPQVVTEEFLFKFGALLSHITSIDASETSLGSAIGQAGSEELIRNTLSAVEAITQHPALLTPHHCPVVDCILPPLTSLAFSKNVEWRIISLRVLSEITLLLLSQEAMEEGERRERECNSSTGRLLTLITEALLPQYESLLLEPDPIPVYALKLLVALTEHSSPVNSLVRDSRILPVVFQVMAEHQDNILGGTMQKAMALLSNLTGQKDVDLQPFYQQGLVEVVCSVFSEAAVLYVEREERPGRKSSHDLLLSLLDTLHNVLTSTSRVVRIALQGAESQGETQAAEDLLLINKPLTQLTSLLIQMLPCEDVEVYEETSQCLSLLMQLYGGDSPDSLSPLNLQSLSHALQLQTQPKQHRLLLRIVKRL